MRCDVLEGHRFAVGESNELARIRDAWWEPRITKRIVQRGSEIFVQRFIRVVRVAGVISVNPSLRSTAAHISDNFSIGRTPRQAVTYRFEFVPDLRAPGLFVKYSGKGQDGQKFAFVALNNW